MTKKVIQVPVDEGLLKQLDSLSKRQHKTRSGLIREACLRYLHEIEQSELDRLYQRGYERIPEDAGTGEIQIAVSGEFMIKESW